MPRRQNVSKGQQFSITLAEQSVRVLERLARLGPYGRNPAEVGGRLLEQVLTEKFLKQPRFNIKSRQRQRS